MSIDSFFQKYSVIIKKLLTTILTQVRSVKMHLKLYVKLVKPGIESSEDRDVYLYGITHMLLNSDDIDEVLFSSASNIVDNLNTFCEQGSSWTLFIIQFICIDISRYRPFRVGEKIQLPSCLNRRRGLINPPVSTKECFQYCIAAYALKFKTKEEGKVLKSYDKFFRVVNKNNQFVNLKFCPRNGMEFKDIRKFERVNPTWSVNIFCYEFDEDLENDRNNEDDSDDELNSERLNVELSFRKTAEIYPVKIAPKPLENHVNLLVISDKGEEKFHYVYISDFSSFMGRKNSHRSYWCMSCMCKFSSKVKQEQHFVDCRKFGVQSIKFPNQHVYENKNIRFSIPHSFYIVADFECLVTKMQIQRNLPNNESYTSIEARHEVTSFCWALASSFGIVKFNVYEGADAGKHFLIQILKLADEIIPLYNASDNYIMTAEDFEKYENDNICRLCNEKIDFWKKSISKDDDVKEYQKFQEMYKKVYHHDHSALGTTATAGKLICAAHAVCNLKAKTPLIVPCIFHNSRNYDSKIIVQALYNAGVQNIQCIAKNSENILSMTIDDKIRFIDSFSHLPSSLVNLVLDMDPNDPKSFISTKRIFKRDEKYFHLLIGKQSFPYEYVTKSNMNRRIRKFPPKSSFYSPLKNENI